MAKKQDPKRNLRIASDSLTIANKNNPWVQRYLQGNKLNLPDPYNPGSGKTSSHGLSYHPLSDSTAMIYPEIVQEGDSLRKFDTNDEARQYAIDNNTGIITDEELAKYYSENGLIDHTKFAKGGDVMANLKKLKRKKRMPKGGIIPEGGQVGVKDNKFKGAYPIGTPLKDIYNLDTSMGEQAQLMATQPIKDSMNQARDANYKGYWTDYPEGQTVPSLRYTPAVLKDMKERGITKEYIESWQPDNYPEEYGKGGDIASGAASGAMTGMVLGPWGAAAGAVIGGVAGWLGSEDEDEISDPYIVPTGLASQHYQRAAAKGGDLTEFTGERHEDGGIDLGGLPVEVEGGETRTKDMIHSDRIEITSDMIKKYPVLKKSDKGKTMAKITKRVHKKFEKRKWDEMNDNAAELAMMPYEDISDELSEQSEPTYAASGGDISATKAREILSHGAIRGKPISAKQSRYFGAKTKAAGGFDLSKAGQYAPLITSGIDTIGALISGPEEVDYGKTSFTPTKVNYASAEPGVQRIRNTYANAESKLRRTNPNRYMARMNDLAAREAGSVTDYAGKIQLGNTQSTNRANLLDAQNATRVNMFNSQTSIREAEANAANRGAHESRIRSNVANMGTMAGQISRDNRLQDSSDAAQDRYFKILEEQNKILGGYGDVNPEEEDVFTNVDPLSATPNYPLYAYGGELEGDPKLPKGYQGVTTEGIPYGEFRDFPQRGIWNKGDSRTSGLQATGKEQYADNKIELANMIENRNPQSKRISNLRQNAQGIYDYLKTRPKMGDKYVDVDAISYANGGPLSHRLRLRNFKTA